MVSERLAGGQKYGDLTEAEKLTFPNIDVTYNFGRHNVAKLAHRRMLGMGVREQKDVGGCGSPGGTINQREGCGLGLGQLPVTNHVHAAAAAPKKELHDFYLRFRGPPSQQHTATLCVPRMETILGRLLVKTWATEANQEGPFCRAVRFGPPPSEITSMLSRWIMQPQSVDRLRSPWEDQFYKYQLLLLKVLVQLPREANGKLYFCRRVRLWSPPAAARRRLSH